MFFKDVIGQEEAKQRLIREAKEGKIAHARLFCGPEGIGKLPLAIAFARYLSCNNPGENDACGLCPSCVKFNKLAHPDLHFVFPVIKKKAKDTVSDDFILEWRELLSHTPYFNLNIWLEEMGAENQQAQIYVKESDEIIRKLSLKSSQGGYKIMIIWLPEKMNVECSNKLLKLLEEPPSQTIFIMICEEPDKLLETIRSRAQRITIKKIDDDSIRKALVEQRGISEQAANRIARMANGNWLKALEELQVGSENELFLDLFQSLMRLAYMRNIKDLKKWSEVIGGYGREKQKRFLLYFLRLIRENFMYNFGKPDINYMSEREEEFASKFARFVNEGNILQINDLANRAIRDIGQNANGKIVFFDMALQMIVLIIQKK